MCLLVIDTRLAPGTPILVAANREEAYARPTEPPAWRDGDVAVFCGRDLQAGGTWLGINQHGVLAAVTNRSAPAAPPGAQSRGLLCCDALQHDRAEDAAGFAAEQLRSGQYAGANLLCADARGAFVVHGGTRVEVVRLPAGRYGLTNGDVDDPSDARLQRAQRLFEQTPYRTGEEFFAAARRVCAAGPEPGEPALLLRGATRGTVSSCVVVLSAAREASRFWYAPGPPDQTAYSDLSACLHQRLYYAPAGCRTGRQR